MSFSACDGVEMLPFLTDVLMPQDKRVSRLPEQTVFWPGFRAFSHRKIKKINTKLIWSYYNVLLDKKAQLT